MIDTDVLLTNLYDLFAKAFPVNDLPQIVNGEQDIPIGTLIYPRIVYRLINEYGDDVGLPCYVDVATENTGTDKDKFPYNSKRVYRKAVTFGITIDGFGIRNRTQNKNCKPYLRKLREFLSIKENTYEFLDSLGYAIISVGSIDERGMPVPTYEDRNGFDLILQVDEKIEIIKSTIEEVVVENIL